MTVKDSRNLKIQQIVSNLKSNTNLPTKFQALPLPHNAMAIEETSLTGTTVKQRYINVLKYLALESLYTLALRTGWKGNKCHYRN